MAKKKKTKKSSKKSNDKSVGPNLPKDWSDEDLGYLYVAREEGQSYYAIAAGVKRSVDEVKKVYRSVNWIKTDFYDPNKKTVKDAVKKAYLDKLNNYTENQIKTENIKMDLMCDAIAKNVTPYDKAPEMYVKSKSKTKNKSSNEEDVVLLFSDTHIGQEVSLEETNGISEYNIDIFHDRLDKLKENSTRIIELHKKLYDIKKLHLFCLGDIVHGMNNAGSWSPAYINMPIYDQMMAGFEAISEAIYYWLGLFDEIHFYGIRGNHSRSASKGDEKDYCNWDLLCYKFVETRFKDNDRVVINAPKAWYTTAEVRNSKFLLLHGDDLRGGGSNVLDKIDNATMKMMGLLKEIPDYAVAGHYHTASEMATNYGKVIANGSFIGSDMYSLKDLQVGNDPVQKMFGVHDEKGITWSYDIRLDM